MTSSTLKEKHPWTQPWWKAEGENVPVLVYILLIHVLSIIGLVLFPLPGWKVFLSFVGLAALGGLGTTVGFHRGLSHRAVKLNPVVEQILIFFAVFNGSGSPSTWIANHRNHHANSDTINDVSSPRHGGFWWAHLRWLWQAEQAAPIRYCPDLSSPSYQFWTLFQIPLLAFSFFGGGAFGAAAFFWLGAIRLVFALHGQCFVNSVCHLRPETVSGEDSSRNVTWLGFWHLFQGENWHRNHHARPGSARLGWTPTQFDVGWWIILGLEWLGLATEVRRPRGMRES